MIDNYLRFVNGPRPELEHIVCFDSRSLEDIDRVHSEIRRRINMKVVIWRRVPPFESIREVGEWWQPRTNAA